MISAVACWLQLLALSKGLLKYLIRDHWLGTRKQVYLT